MLRNVTAFVAVLTAFVLVGTSPMKANPANYSVGVTAGTYAEITGGTTIFAANSDWFNLSDVAIALPFTVNYNGTLYSQVFVGGNGWISFGAALGAGATNPLVSSGSSVGILSAFGTQLCGRNGGDVTWAVSGVSPNRVATIQWRNATRRYSDNIGRDAYNFQIRIYENATTLSGNRLEVVYGSMTLTNIITTQLGLGANSNVRSPQCHPYTNASWAAPAWFTTPQSSVMMRGFVPASGTTHTYWFRQGTNLNNDAGIVSLVSPAAKFTENTDQTIQVRVRNWGTNNLDSVTINWTINGVTQVPVRYYPQPALTPGTEATITLGTRSFAPFSFNTIEFGTLSPNGVTDVNTGNDKLTVFLAPRVSGALNVAQNGNPGVFPNFRTLYRHLFISGINGNVDVTVFAGTYDEQLLIPQVDATSGRVQLAPRTGDNVVLTSAVHPTFNVYNGQDIGAVISFADGASNNSLRNLTVRVADLSPSNAAVFSANVGANNVVDGGVYEGPSNFATTVGATSGVQLLSLTGASNLVVRNATFRRFRNGFVIQTTGSGVVASGNTIENVVNGLTVANAVNALVEGNTYTSCDCVTSVQGISLTNVNGGAVRNNRINAIQTTGLANGMVLNSQTRGILVANNMISVAGTSQTIALWVEVNTTINQIINNTVNVTGTGTTSTALYAPLAVTTGQLDLINNIFHAFGTGTNGQLAMWFTANTASNGGINPIRTGDFNNIMTTGTNLVNWGGTIVTRNVAPTNPLTNWRATSGRDQNSASVAVEFVGGSDLHLRTIQSALWGSGTTVALVPTDYDGEPRTKPYMGADEIKPQIRMITEPASAYVCLGGTDTLICIAEVTTGATTTYQWFKDGNELTGQTGNILVLSNTGYGASGVYSCLVKANDGTNFVQLASQGASVIVVRPTSITEHPVSQPVAIGGTANFSVAAEAIGAPDNFNAQYQWKKRYWNPNSTSYVDTNIVDNGRITGAQSSILSIRDVRSSDTADMYVCEVVGFCGTVTSKAARLFAPVVVASNMSPSVCFGGQLSLECAAYPSSLPGSTASFQWFKGGVALANGGQVSGANGKVLTISQATSANDGAYYCVTSYDGTGYSFSSNTVDVTVGVPPAITTQPEGTTVCEGGTLSLSGASSGGNLTYQWLKGTTPIPGATSATYTKSNVTAADAGSYSLVATNACGSATSVAVDLAVATGALVSAEPADVAINTGERITFTVEAAGTGTIAYQWYLNDVAIAGATEATYTVERAQMSDAGQYYCIVANTCGADTSRRALASITNGVTNDVAVGGFVLSVATPNPTFDVASFNYSVPSSQNVRMVVTDMMGREVATIVNNFVNAGAHRATFSASELSLTAGVYSVTLQAGGIVATQQVVVVK